MAGRCDNSSGSGVTVRVIIRCHEPVLFDLYLQLFIVLGLAGCCSPQDARELSKKLHSPVAKERSAVALSLAYCGRNGEVAVPRLAKLLYDENPGVQSMAAYALRKIDTPAAQTVRNRIDASRRK